MVMLWAGFWQLRRAEEKASINSKLAQSTLNQPHSLKDWEELKIFDSIEVSGHYANIHFLLDNQIIAGQVGYFLYSAFKTEDDVWLLVNRGWVDDDQQNFDVNNQQTEVLGLLTDWPRPGIQLGEQTLLDAPVQHVTYLPQEQVFSLLKQRLCTLSMAPNCDILPRVLKLDPQMKYGYLRQWELPRMTAEKHRGYAVQWFSMSLVLCFVYVVFLRKNYLS